VQVESALSARSHLSGGRVVLATYSAAIFCGASLVFLIQPMVAKMALPLFGGTPAVWNTALLFFQAVLLGGYAYAHASTRLLGLRRQPMVHLLFLLAPLAVLPLALPANAAPSGTVAPALWLLYVLAVSVGLPFFVVTTASPLLQRWFSSVDHAASADPYFLYAASNAGSLLALIGYPLVVEPNLTLQQQSKLWTGLYLVFVLLSVACAWLLARSRTERPVAAAVVAEPSERIAWATRFRWVLLAFVPSSLMIGVTSFISTDIAAVPLLWVLPLSIYLLTFIFAFSGRSILGVGTAARVLPVIVVVSLIIDPDLYAFPIVAVILAHLAVLFVAAMLAHGSLAAGRPGAAHLTEFYLLVSVGGVLGGVFNALLAPVMFNTVLEYPIALVLALLLRPAAQKARSERRYGWTLDFILPFLYLLGVIAVVAITADGHLAVVAALAGMLIFARRPIRFAATCACMLALLNLANSSALMLDRTFFGVTKVLETSTQMHQLVSGTTVHGMQSYRGGHPSDEPISYYMRSGPVGQLFDGLQQSAPFRQVGVIGLGGGALAAYGRDGQTFTYYEIDPAVIRVASDPRYFTYLRDSRATVRTVVGDGRLELAKAPDAAYDLLVLDAFSSDSVPAHLLTREALQLYLSKLQPGGAIVMNLSNRNLDLEPVISAEARELGLAGLSQTDLAVSDAQRRAGKLESRWIVLARTRADLGPLVNDSRWHELAAPGDLWTDDFSNIIDTIRWFG
jgi:spermidine synthase